MTRTRRNRHKMRRRANRVRRERAADEMPAVRERYEKEMASRVKLAIVLLAASAAIVMSVAALLS